MSQSPDIGELYTWTVDFEETLRLRRSRNPDLQVGIALAKKIENDQLFIYVSWLGDSGAWSPADSVRKINADY